ncbi:aspartate/glutamate racemase family protein [Radicibacter daui]|uniref:aspartate/glutamate racemase family protein n=1 Tax=Radicibacter daui TaxID=3064829 RepID=UPI004046FA14
MRLLLINPNCSADMTARIADGARARLAPDVEVEAMTASFGGDVIASRASYAIAGHAALDCLARAGAGFDGILLTCFGDPGLEALREVSGAPVAGLLEASLEVACRTGKAFGIVTAGALWRDMLEERIGPTARPLYRGTEILNLSGLAISRDPELAAPAIGAACRQLQGAGAEVIILGGAAMIDLAKNLPPDLLLIDCLSAGLTALQERTSADTTTARAPQSFISSQGLSPALATLLAGN